MKQLLLFLFIPFLGYGQTVELRKTKNGDFFYQEVIEANRASVKQIQEQVLSWIAIYHSTADIQLEKEG